jgi:mxaL protein
MRPVFYELRFWHLVAAFLLIVASLFLPRVKLTGKAYDTLAVVDITKSMNVRDLTLGGRPASRLDVIKDRLRQFAASLPCQSKLGLAIFSERRIFVLFEPIEVCANYAGIDAAITGLDWRMAWEGDSYVTRGVYDAIDVAKNLGTSLVFFTDGHEAPPLPWTGMPGFEGKKGEVSGLLVGVGGKTLSPIPKYDDEGREVGVLDAGDVLQESREGPPPPDASSRPGYHPRNAPFGAMPEGTEHLSSVKEEHLQAIAALTGLSYLYLQSASALLDAFEAVAHPRDVVVATDIRPYPAGFALLLLIILFGVLRLRDWLTRRAVRANPVPSTADKLREAYI